MYFHSLHLSLWQSLSLSLSSTCNFSKECVCVYMSMPCAHVGVTGQLSGVRFCHCLLGARTLLLLNITPQASCPASVRQFFCLLLPSHRTMLGYRCTRPTSSISCEFWKSTSGHQAHIARTVTPCAIFQAPACNASEEQRSDIWGWREVFSV